jgi:hypothetical protein
MKTWTLAAALFLASTCGIAQTAQTTPAAPTGRKPCDDLKAEISKKLDTKGVVNYTLDIVDKGKEGDAKVVGSCDGGTKSITYTRGGAVSQKPPADTKQPQ